MAATPILAQGTTFTYNSQTVAGIVSITGIGSGSATEIPATTLASTAKEFRQGLQDFGDVTIQLIRNLDDAGQAALLAAMAAQSTNTAVLTLPTSTLNVCTFSAFVKQITSDVNADGIVTGTCVLRITGAPSWA